METVKVDMQKLQLLNDRIAQTIEALNLVRMSVHGIQHTHATPSPWGYGAAYGVTPPLGCAVPFVSPFGAGPYAGTPFGATPYAATPYAGTPYAATALGGIQHSSASMVSPTLGGWTMPYGSNGISHTAWDPAWQARAAQTFPLVQYPYPVPIS
jgi:hypothetical protein